MGFPAFSLSDLRTDPEKSARAAARYLKQLHGKFGNRALAQSGTKSYTAIAEKLPAETRMDVPKVCALVALRAGVAPNQIAAPRR